MSGFLDRLRGAKDSLKDDAWRARAAWRMEGQRKRAEQLRVENPDEYQRILDLATDDGKRLIEVDPDGYVAFVLADMDKASR